MSPGPLDEGDFLKIIFYYTQLCLYKSNEKLVIQKTVGQQGAAASIAPRRVEMVSKWANTAAQITNITLGATSGNYNVPSFLKIWGSD